MHDLNVPLAVKPYADQVAAVTDAVCRAHLDDQDTDLCRDMVAELGRKRPSSLIRGDLLRSCVRRGCQSRVTASS